MIGNSGVRQAEGRPGRKLGSLLKVVLVGEKTLGIPSQVHSKLSPGFELNPWKAPSLHYTG